MYVCTCICKYEYVAKKGIKEHAILQVTLELLGHFLSWSKTANKCG